MHCIFAARDQGFHNESQRLPCVVHTLLQDRSYSIIRRLYREADRRAWYLMRGRVPQAMRPTHTLQPWNFLYGHGLHTYKYVKRNINICINETIYSIYNQISNIWNLKMIIALHL